MVFISILFELCVSTTDPGCTKDPKIRGPTCRGFALEILMKFCFIMKRRVAFPEARHVYNFILDHFKEALEFCVLHDLGFVGDVFTWRNKQYREEDYIQERLDRAVANGAWREWYPLVLVRNGDPYHSDHRPMIITTKGAHQSDQVNGGVRPFNFEASWVKDEACVGVVSEAWELGGARGEGSIAERFRSVVGSLHSWSVNMLGDLEKRMKRLKKELEKCRRSPIDDASVHREAVLIYRLDKVEEQKDIFWRQHAHADWLEKGDRNTSFIHKWCSERKRRNRIGRLKKEDGGWVEEELEKQDLFANHFMQLFNSKGDR